MKYTNRSSVGEGSVQSARMHRLVKAFIDQVWSEKKRIFTNEVKSRHRLIRAFSDVYVAFRYCSGKYQNKEKPLKRQRNLGLVTDISNV